MNAEQMTTANNRGAQVLAPRNGKSSGKNGSAPRDAAIVRCRWMMLSPAPRWASAVEKRKTSEKSRVSTPSAYGQIRSSRPRWLEGSAEVRPVKTSNCLGKSALFARGEENLCARPCHANARSWHRSDSAENAKPSEKMAVCRPSRGHEPWACPERLSTSARTGCAATVRQNQRNSREKRHSLLADERQLVRARAQRTGFPTWGLWQPASRPVTEL